MLSQFALRYALLHAFDPTSEDSSMKSAFDTYNHSFRTMKSDLSPLLQGIHKAIRSYDDRFAVLSLDLFTHGVMECHKEVVDWMPRTMQVCDDDNDDIDIDIHSSL